MIVYGGDWEVRAGLPNCWGGRVAGDKRAGPDEDEVGAVREVGQRLIGLPRVGPEQAPRAVDADGEHDDLAVGVDGDARRLPVRGQPAAQAVLVKPGGEG